MSDVSATGRTPAAAAADAEIVCDIRNRIAFITLNRPAALNALSFAMIGELGALLQRCADDAGIHAVLLRGAGDKAFCAGGDIRALYQSFKESGSLHREFFAAEYPLVHFLHRFPKPYIALLDGITMGGGMGLAQGSRLRIVGERTRMAMPEVGIGLFPDVGGSYFLSRLPGALGPYLALTGVTIRGADSVYAGLADLYMTPGSVNALSDALDTVVWSGDREADVRRVLESLAAEPPAAPLRPLRSAIDAHFSLPTVTGILASLECEAGGEHAAWAEQTAKLMRNRSPTMMAVALRQLQLGSSMSLADCFRMELGMVQQCFEQGDFVEGVRALIIDKDNAPRWQPARLDDVTAASVDAFFRPRWRGTDHPLAHL
jgi:enoyl-CoA hydratase/carnithine racemase